MTQAGWKEDVAIAAMEATLGEHLAATHGLVQVGTTPDVQEQFHLIYSARKVMHPLLTRLLEAGSSGSLLN